MEGESIAIIDISQYLKTKHTYTAGRGRASTGVIYTGVITIHHICIGDGDGDVTGSRNADNDEDSIVSSPPS